MCVAENLHRRPQKQPADVVRVSFQEHGLPYQS